PAAAGCSRRRDVRPRPRPALRGREQSRDRLRIRHPPACTPRDDRDGRGRAHDRLGPDERPSLCLRAEELRRGDLSGEHVSVESPPRLSLGQIAGYFLRLGTTVIQALFYGIGPTVIALILRGAWKLLGVTVKNDRRLWAIFAVVTLITFAVRSEVAVLFVLAGFLGVLLYAPPGWLRRPAISPAAIPLGLGTL